MKTSRETAIEILEWLNFDPIRCEDWIEGIAQRLEANAQSSVHWDRKNITVAGMTIPEIVAMKAKLAALEPCPHGKIPAHCRRCGQI